MAHLCLFVSPYFQIERPSSPLSPITTLNHSEIHFRKLTPRLYLFLGIKILKYHYLSLTLPAQVVEPLLWIPHQIHGRAGVVATYMVGFDEVSRVYGGAIAESEGPVLDGGNQWSPDAVGNF